MKVTLLASLLLATAMFAQRPGGPPDRNHMAGMATLLSLNAGQQAQATKVYADARTASKAIHASMRTAQTSLAEAVKKNDVASIDALTAQMGTYHGQLMAIESKAEASFYSSLTAEQQAKYDTLHHGFGGFGGPGGPGAAFHRGGHAQ